MEIILAYVFRLRGPDPFLGKVSNRMSSQEGTESGVSPAARESIPALATSQAAAKARPSLIRAWLALVVLSWQRQARARQMVWIATGLLVLATAVVGINTARTRIAGIGHWQIAPDTSQLAARSGWGMYHWRHPRFSGPTFDQWTHDGQLVYSAAQHTPAALGIEQAVFGAARLVVAGSGLMVFARWVVFSIFLSFLLPVWSLSFATEALGGDRETNSLLWLLTRPLPRPAIYLGKFLAVLPWSIGFNVGGFAILCIAGGSAGMQAFRLFWPAVMWATLAFAALFFLMGAIFRRPAVMAILYAFFLETVLANMPGTLKRISIGFYTRCLMFDRAQALGIEPEKPEVFAPVSGTTAQITLIGLTLALLVLGMVLFSRKEYHDVV